MIIAPNNARDICAIIEATYPNLTAQVSKEELLMSAIGMSSTLNGQSLSLGNNITMAEANAGKPYNGLNGIGAAKNSGITLT